MNRRFVLLIATILLAALAAVPIAAQGPGEGGILIEGNTSDPTSLNPIMSTKTTDSDVHFFLFPDLIRVNPLSGVYEPNVARGLASGWDISEDGLVYTFTIREDMYWSDGVQITGEDYKFAFDAVASGVVDSPRTSVLDFIDTVEVPDPFTVVVTFKSNSCNNLDQLDDFGVVPAHAWREAIGDDFALMNEADFNMNPTVTYGPFVFGEFRAGDQTALLANQDYADAILGYVSPQGWVFKSVPDQTVMVEQFIAGETNVLRDPPPERMASLREMDEGGEIEFFQFPQNGYTWMAYNLADPADPQPGLDENGEVVDQGHHPIFGDVRVRQALAMAVDMEGIMAGAVFGEGSRMISNVVPTSWAFKADMEPWPYDPEAALALLNEAGWEDQDGDGVLEAHGAMYAEDGTPMSFSLQTNADNPVRVAAGTVIQDQLGQIGIDVNFQSVEFGALVEVLLGQTYDAVILGWNNDFPDDPDATSLYTPQNDVPGSAFNFVSYNNPEVTRLMDEALHVPGCDVEARRELYGQLQEIFLNDQPYMYLFAPDRGSGVLAGTEGFDPKGIDDPLGIYWNVDAWSLAP